MTDDQKREHAEAIKHALGMGEYGPPMEGEEGWVPPKKLDGKGWCIPVFDDTIEPRPAVTPPSAEEMLAGMERLWDAVWADAEGRK